MKTSRLLLLMSALLVATGCPKDEKKDDKSSESDKKDKDKKKKGDDDDKDDDDKGGKGKGKKKGDDKDDKADKGDDKGDDKDEAPKPKKLEIPKDTVTVERSKAPTVAEWNAAADVETKGNEVGCEVRTVREWLRISCRKKSPTGGEPTAVWVARGKHKETLFFVAKGVTSMVTPFLPGTDMQALYSWSDVVYAADIVWPHGKDKPKVMASFHKSDEKPVEGIQSTGTCECFKQIYKKTKCDDNDDDWKITAVNHWCEATYAKQCQEMMECSRGEPGRWPKCPKGYTNAGMGHYCQKLCDDGKCPAGFSCVDGEIAAQGKKVCEEKS